MSTRAEELPTLDEPDPPPAPRPRRRIPHAVLAAAAVLAAIAAYRYLRPASGTAPAGYVTNAVDRGPIEQTDLDTAQSNYDQAVAQIALDQAAVAQAQASLEESQVNLRYTDILSPVDGGVVSRNVDVGQTVAASFQTPTLFLIAQDLTKMQVDTNVSESDVGRVQEEQPAAFTVDAYPGQRFRGKVAQVRNAPITVQNVVTYDVVVAVDNAKLELKPGMTANVTVATAKREQALRIAVRALRFRPDEAGAAAPGAKPKEESAVYVLAPDGALRRVEVQTGVRDNQHVEVVGGDLHEGDRVVIGLRRESTEAAPAARPPGFGGARRAFGMRAPHP